MKPLFPVAAALAAGFLAVPPAGSAEPPSLAAPQAPSELRREMLAEYPNAPPGTKAAAPPTALPSRAPPIFASAAPRDVVRMDPFEVQESGPGAGGALLTPEDVKVPPPTVASKLGIGVHGKDVGKVRVFAVTLFYVPIMVGFAW